MATLNLLKRTILSSLLISIIVAADNEENLNVYFNDELNRPPPQLETFKTYEEMRKYLENNSNVELIDNPTFDTYLSAYNLHHSKDGKLRASQNLQTKQRTKRKAVPIPYDFIKFELSDAREPDENTKELLRKYRERELRSLNITEGKKIENVSETEINKENNWNGSFDEEDIATTAKPIEKMRRVTKRIPRKYQNKSETIKRMDINDDDDPLSFSDDGNDDGNDMNNNESQNVHYYAAVPYGDGASKHKNSNMFPHEVQKAIDYVLSDNKLIQNNPNGGASYGKTTNVKNMQLPIYHKQPYHYGDKLPTHQSAKIKSNNKQQSSDYDEAYHKYLQLHSHPLKTNNNEFKQSPPIQLHHTTAEEQKNLPSNEQNHRPYNYQQVYNQHRYQYPIYYTTPNSAHSMPLQYENSQQEIKQSPSTGIIYVPSTQQSYIASENSSNENSVLPKREENSSPKIQDVNSNAALPDINQVHAIIHPQAVALKIVPEINYVFNQETVPVKLISAIPAHASIQSYNPPPTQSTGDTSSDNGVSEKLVQYYEAPKHLPLPAQYYYKGYEHLHQQPPAKLYAPVDFQNEMLAKAALINHGYKFDDSTNLANNNIIHGVPINHHTGGAALEVEDLNKKYPISELGIPSHGYILSTTPNPHSYDAYIRGVQPTHVHANEQYQHELHQNNAQIFQAPHPQKYIYKQQQQLKPEKLENDNKNTQQHYKPSSLSFKELSALVGKSPKEQMQGLNYLIEKELQHTQLQAKNTIRPQDNRAPILFHPDKKNGGDDLRGKNVYINEYGFKEVRKDDDVSLKSGSAAASSTTVKPVKEQNIESEPNKVVHITPAPISTSLKQYHSLSPNYNFGTKLYGLAESENKETSKLQYASKYAFGYRVRDWYTGNDFGHKQKRDRDGVTRGEYHILLPDGRVQNVHYTADDSGFHADVSFEAGS